MRKIFAKGVHYHENFSSLSNWLGNSGESCVSGEVHIEYWIFFYFFFFLTRTVIGIQISCPGSGVTIFENVQQESGWGTWGMV